MLRVPARQVEAVRRLAAGGASAGTLWRETPARGLPSAKAALLAGGLAKRDAQGRFADWLAGDGAGGGWVYDIILPPGQIVRSEGVKWVDLRVVRGPTVDSCPLLVVHTNTTGGPLCPSRLVPPP